MTSKVIGISAILVFLSCAPSLSMTDDDTFFHNLEPGKFPVGFTLKHIYDHSRTFIEKDRFEASSGEVTSRPMQISIWYPARVSDNPVHMKYGEYIDTIGTQISFDKPDEAAVRRFIDTYVGSPGDVDNANSVKPALSAILAGQTLALRDAEPEKGTFPLIIYGPGGDWEAFDNSVLCEYLASHGFVVASCTSFGENTRGLSYGVRGIENNTRDLEFVLASMSDFPNVDFSCVGAMGFSWNGIVVLNMAMRNKRIQAIVSLDGTESMARFVPAYPAMVFLNRRSFNVPFMLTIGTEDLRGEGFYDLGFYDNLKYADKYLIRFEQLEHGYFCSRNVLMSLQARRPAGDEYRTLVDTSYSALCSYVSNFFTTYLKKDPAAKEFITATAEANGLNPSILSVTSREGEEMPPLDEAFIQVIREKGADKAFEILREQKLKNPETVICPEAFLNALGYEFLLAERVEEAIAVFEMNVFSFPASANVYDSLGEAYMKNGETDLSRNNYLKSLELDPGNDNARQMLEQMEKK